MRLWPPINIPKTYKQQKRRTQTTQKENNLVQSRIQQECFNESQKSIPKQFPQCHKFYKLFNKNNVKGS